MIYTLRVRVEGDLFVISARDGETKIEYGVQGTDPEHSAFLKEIIKDLSDWAREEHERLDTQE